MKNIELIEIATRFLGFKSVKYHNPLAGVNPSHGFDCSGFVRYVCSKVRLYVPRHCNEMFDQSGILIHPEKIAPGDLLFLSRDGLRPTHVGFVVNHDEYIHSPGVSDGVVCVSQIPWGDIDTSNHGQIYTKNPIGFKRLGIRDGRWFKPFAV